MLMPKHGELLCEACKQFFAGNSEFGDEDHGYEEWRTKNVRLINNPCSWGGRSPEIVVFGFSKGSTQNQALELYNEGRLSYGSVAFFEDRGGKSLLTSGEYGGIWGQIFILDNIPSSRYPLFMARPWRREYKDASYHVTCGGECTVEQRRNEGRSKLADS